MSEHENETAVEPEVVVNGSWKNISRVSHIAGWFVAAFFGGMQFSGWVHIQSSNVRFERVNLAIEKNAKAIDKAVDLILTHGELPAHREAALLHKTNTERIQRLEERR